MPSLAFAISPDVQFIIVSLVKILGIIFLVILPLVSYTVYAERRVSAMIQDRVGPNRVGIAGLLQPIADAVKFLLKEDLTPAHVNKFYYWLAPCLAMVPAILTIAVVPFGSTLNIDPIFAALGDIPLLRHVPLLNTLLSALSEIRLGTMNMVIANVDIGVMFVFAIASLGVYGIVLAGWSSNSKYPFLGGVRSTSQMISYELSLGLSVVPIFLVMGTLNLSQIVQNQIVHGWTVLPFTDLHLTLREVLLWVPMLISFFVFTVAIFAETNRLPFDLPESETELVAGYHTEYSSMKFALFFLGEYAAMITGCSIIVTLFLGGWHFPGIPDGSHGWVWGLVNIATFFAKVSALLLFFIFIRWTLPRFRYDQLMKLGWIFFFEIALVNILLVALILAYFPK